MTIEELKARAVEDMRYLVSQIQYQPCKTCRHCGEFNTQSFCRRIIHGKLEKCPNMSFPYWSWRYEEL